METSAQQVVKGVVADYILQCLDVVRSRIQDEFRRCTRDVQTARQSAANYGQPETVQHLMGQTQCLWDRDAIQQRRVEALTE